MSDIPEADGIEGVAHPRETLTLRGQEKAVATFLQSYNSDRLHHAWLITGQRGIGKATLAWRIARFMLTQSDDQVGMFASEPVDLTPDQNHPAYARISALSEPGLFLLRRSFDEDKKRLRQVIRVDEIRGLHKFLGLSRPDGGWRVVIVDSIDDANNNAANALLKLLEEPPAQTLFLLVSHAPTRLLPTIRSRCQALRCEPLGQEDLGLVLQTAEIEAADLSAITELAGGSAGKALQLAANNGLELYHDILSLAETLPNMNRTAAIKLAEKAASRSAPEQFDICVELVDIFLSRLTKVGLGHTVQPVRADETSILLKLCDAPAKARDWANLASDLTSKARYGKSVNLDPSSLILDMLLSIQEQASKLAA